MACNRCGFVAPTVYRDETDAHRILCGECYVEDVLGVRAAVSATVNLSERVVYQVGGSDVYHRTPTCSYFDRAVDNGTKSVWVRQREDVESTDIRPNRKCTRCFCGDNE